MSAHGILNTAHPVKRFPKVAKLTPSTMGYGASLAVCLRVVLRVKKIFNIQSSCDYCGGVNMLYFILLTVSYITI